MYRYRWLFLLSGLLLISACGGGSSGGDNGTGTSPGALSVVEVGNGSVTLTWNGVSGAQSYRLYQASEPITSIDNIHAHSDGDWTADVSAPYTVTGLTNHVTYYFVVTAVVAGTESGPSNQVNATPVEVAAGLQPTPREVRMIELINRARFDPNAEVERNNGVDDLNQGLAAGTISANPKPPLAFNELLMLAARGHSRWMLDTNTFSHTGEGGSTPQQRIQASGYGAPSLSGENISVVGDSQLNLTLAIDTHHASLFESPSHRVNILREGFREVGIGQEQGSFDFGDNSPFPSSMLTQKYARIGSQFFITGVIYQDGNNNTIYDVGEGLGGIVVTVDETVYQAYDSGIYSIAVADNATYNITFAGGILTEPVQSEVQVMGGNVKLDIVITGDTVNVVTW